MSKPSKFRAETFDMSLTKAQWAEIEQQLSGFFGQVELLCDGYKINANVKNIAPMRQGIVVYVNGRVTGAWLDGKAAEPRKFYRERKHYVWSAAQRADAAKKAKGRHMQADLREIYRARVTASVSVWVCWWTSPKSFTRHLRKTCADISVVKIGQIGY